MTISLRGRRLGDPHDFGVRLEAFDPRTLELAPAQSFAARSPSFHRTLVFKHAADQQRRKRPRGRHRGRFMTWIEKLQRASAVQAERRADPWREKLNEALRGMEAMGTAALLDLLDVPKTTGSARRLATTMRSMGWVGLKSRRLMPGGYFDTTTRGWMRPLRENRYSSPLMNSTAGAAGINQDGGYHEISGRHVSREHGHARDHQR
jgi:hypothetical protein